MKTLIQTFSSPNFSTLSNPQTPLTAFLDKSYLPLPLPMQHSPPMQEADYNTNEDALPYCTQAVRREQEERDWELRASGTMTHSLRLVSSFERS